MDHLDEMIRGYIDAMYFTDVDEISEDDELDSDTELDIDADCRSFYRRVRYYLPLCPGQSARTLGHDFWLTRNGHGAGFWDGGWPEAYGKMFTEIAKGYGEINSYKGDDGHIFQM
jgi:hypothetical protein